MEGKRRDEEDMQDSLLVEEGTGLIPLHILLQGSFCQLEVKQTHRRDAQRPSIMHTLPYNFLKKKLFYWGELCAPANPVEMSFGEKKTFCEGQ